MIDSGSVLILTSCMFFIGLLGICIKSSDIISIFISIEIIVSASIINFCYFSQYFDLKIGHLFSIVAIVLSTILFIIIFASFSASKNKRSILGDD